MILRFHPEVIPPAWKIWTTVERDDQCYNRACEREHREYEWGLDDNLPILHTLALMLLWVVFIAMVAYALFAP